MKDDAIIYFGVYGLFLLFFGFLFYIGSPSNNPVIRKIGRYIMSTAFGSILLALALTGFAGVLVAISLFFLVRGFVIFIKSDKKDVRKRRIGAYTMLGAAISLLASFTLCSVG